MKALVTGAALALAISAASAQTMPNANQTPESSPAAMPNANQTPEQSNSLPNGTMTTGTGVSASGTLNGDAPLPAPPSNPQCVPGAATAPTCMPPNPSCVPGQTQQIGTACPPPPLPTTH